MQINDRQFDAGACPPPEVIERFDPDAVYRGPVVARRFGQAWQTWLNRRSAGLDSPRATIISGRIWYRGRDLNEWVEGHRER